MRFVIILNDKARREIAFQMMRGYQHIVNIDTKPRTIHGWPYRIDHSQKQKFRVVTI